MSFHSGYAYKVNADRQILVDCAGSNVTATLDTTGLATSANQVTANASLANIDSNTSGLATELTLTNVSTDTQAIDGKMTQGYDAQVASGGSGLFQTVCYGRDTAGNLDALKTSSNGNLECEVSGPLGSNLSFDSVSVVVASDQSAFPVNVNEGNAVSGSHANLDNGTSVTAGVTSTAITTNKARCISIFGNTTGIDDITIQVSADGTNYYPFEYSMFPDGNGDFNSTLRNVAVGYVRLKYNGIATVTATAQFA